MKETETPIGLLIMFYIAMTFVVALWTFFCFRNRNTSFLNKAGTFLGTFTILFATFWILSVISPSMKLEDLVLTLSGILLPLVWFLICLGLFLYGGMAFITGKTSIYAHFIPISAKGVGARYMGLIWIITSLALLQFEVYVVGLFLCTNSGDYCHLETLGDSSFSVLIKILYFLSTPLRWIGLI